MARDPRPARARLLSGGAATLALLSLAGCVTGERPTLSAQPESTGDAAADAVLQRLQDAGAATFTADYQIRSSQGAEATATVAQEGPGRRAVTIGATRFLTSGATSSTCEVDSGRCADGLNAARVSDLGVTPSFYDASPATRLRRDAGRRTGPITATTETIGGQPAACVTIPVAQTAAQYCALDAGPLARMRTTDVTVELTGFSPVVDDAQLEP